MFIEATVITTIEMVVVTAAWIKQLYISQLLQIYKALLIRLFQPTLEMKLSPEFKAKIRTMLNGKNFQNCNHFSWIQTTKKETTVENSIAPIIDDVSALILKLSIIYIFLESLLYKISKWKILF